MELVESWSRKNDPPRGLSTSIPTVLPVIGSPVGVLRVPESFTTLPGAYPRLLVWATSTALGGVVEVSVNGTEVYKPAVPFTTCLAKTV